MKKVFKMMACALAACSLFVACGDDENEEEVKDGIKVAFDETSWEATDVLGTDYSAIAGIIQLGAFKDYESETAPYVQGYVPSKVATVSHNSNNDYYYMFYYENENDFTEENGENYPNWQPLQGAFTEEITAIDLTALTLSGNVNGTLFNFKEAVAANSTENATKKSLNVVINNATWESTAKGMGFKEMGKLAK